MHSKSFFYIVVVFVIRIILYPYIEKILFTTKNVHVWSFLEWKYEHIITCWQFENEDMEFVLEIIGLFWTTLFLTRIYVLFINPKKSQMCG